MNGLTATRQTCIGLEPEPTKRNRHGSNYAYLSEIFYMHSYFQSNNQTALYACSYYGLRLSNLIKETTYLLTYFMKFTHSVNFFIIIAFNFYIHCAIDRLSVLRQLY